MYGRGASSYARDRAYDNWTSSVNQACNTRQVEIVAVHPSAICSLSTLTEDVALGEAGKTHERPRILRSLRRIPRRTLEEAHGAKEGRYAEKDRAAEP